MWSSRACLFDVDLRPKLNSITLKRKRASLPAKHDVPAHASQRRHQMADRTNTRGVSFAGCGVSKRMEESMNITLQINGESRSADVDDDTPLLWVLRESFGLNGTKFGCGVAACGACTVHIDGEPARSCSVPASAVQGRAITTIEAAGRTSTLSKAVQQAWIEFQVPQCGYCQSGMIMAVSALLTRTPQPTDDDIDAAITNLCRCGTYERVRRAIHSVADKNILSATSGAERG
jgi:isoquinoline 1-oxidoreductase subunit alpha